jgi:hypothetical protein
MGIESITSKRLSEPNSDKTLLTASSSASSSGFKDLSRAPAAQRRGDRREQSADRSEGRKEKTPSSETASPLLAQADGSFVIQSYFAAPPVARAPVQAKPTQSRLPVIDHAMLHDLKVGQAGTTVRMHATLGQGQHQGVELRATDRNGKIQIELLATDANSARSLRAELPQIRELLSARGLDGVNVSVIAERGTATEQGVERSTSSAHAGERDPRHAERFDPEQTQATAINSRASASSSSPIEEPDQQLAWELL